MSFVSYAQNFEDVLLHRVFGGQETGFYVDVGAYDPVDGSVTKTFYDRGWSGINVEPGIVFEKLAAARPRDVNLQMVVLDRTGEVAFADVATDLGMSHVVLEGENAAARVVPCDTLENIVHAHSHGRPVDFLKVDAEGAEGAIVHSTDWRRFRPRVIVFEATRPWSTVMCNQDWEPALLEQGFVRVYFDGVNCFYVTSEDHAALERHFRAPVNVLDRVKCYDVAAARLAAEAAAGEQQLRAELTSARDALGQLAELRLSHEQQLATHNTLAAETRDLRAELLREGERAETAERQHHDVAGQLDVMSKQYADLTRSYDSLRAEQALLVTRFDACSAKLATSESARHATEARSDALSAECDVLHEQVQALGSQGEMLAIDLAALRSSYEALTAERDRIGTERDALAAARDAMASERATLAAERDHLAASVQERTSDQLRLGAQLQSNNERVPVEDRPALQPLQARATPPRAATRASSKRSFAKRCVLLVYKLVRPVVRPMVWRARSFIVSGVTEQMDFAAVRMKAHVHDVHAETLRELQSVRQAAVVDLPRLLQQMPHSVVQAPPASQTNLAGVEELRRLASEVEHAMLALALLPSTPARAVSAAVDS